MGWGKGKGGKGNRNNDGKGTYSSQFWTCPLNNCAYLNFTSRDRCRLCDSHPGEGSRQHKGGGGSKGGGNGGGGQTLAQRQTDLAKAHARHQKREEQLKREMADLRRQRDEAIAAKSTGHDECDDDEDMEEEDSEDVEEALTLARRKRKAMQGIWDDTDAEVLQVDSEMKRLTKKRDEAKPHRIRLRILEKRVDKAQKHVETKTKGLEEINEKIKGLEAERETHKAALASANKELEDARAERTTELQKAIEEERKSGNTSPPRL